MGASLDLFARKSPRSLRLERFSREESSQRAPPFFCGWWEYKLETRKENHEKAAEIPLPQ